MSSCQYCLSLVKSGNLVKLELIYQYSVVIRKTEENSRSENNSICFSGFSVVLTLDFAFRFEL